MTCAITPEQLASMVDDLDELAVDRILAVGPTIEEVAEALACVEPQIGRGAPRAPCSANAQTVRAILEEPPDDRDYEHAWRSR